MTSQLIMPALALTIAVLGSLPSFFFGVGVAVAVLLVTTILAGGIAYSVSADAFQAFLMIASFGFPILAGAAALGILAGRSLRDRNYLLAASLFAPFPYFLWATHSTEAQKAREEELALAYVTSNEQLIKLAGGRVEVYLASATSYQDSTKGRYEYSIKGHKLYAVVDVTRRSGEPEFSLACVTTLSMGKREGGRDVCEQSTVSLSR